MRRRSSIIFEFAADCLEREDHNFLLTDLHCAYFTTKQGSSSKTLFVSHLYLQALCQEWTTAWTGPGCWLGFLPALVSAGCLSRSVRGQEVSGLCSPPLLHIYNSKHLSTLMELTWLANSRWQTVWSWGSFITAVMSCNMGVIPGRKQQVSAEVKLQTYNMWPKVCGHLSWFGLSTLVPKAKS